MRRESHGSGIDAFNLSYHGYIHLNLSYFLDDWDIAAAFYKLERDFREYELASRYGFAPKRQELDFESFLESQLHSSQTKHRRYGSQKLLLKDQIKKKNDLVSTHGVMQESVCRAFVELLGRLAVQALKFRMNRDICPTSIEENEVRQGLPPNTKRFKVVSFVDKPEPIKFFNSSDADGWQSLKIGDCLSITSSNASFSSEFYYTFHSYNDGEVSLRKNVGFYSSCKDTKSSIYTVKFRVQTELSRFVVSHPIYKFFLQLYGGPDSPDSDYSPPPAIQRLLVLEANWARANREQSETGLAAPGMADQGIGCFNEDELSRTAVLMLCAQSYQKEFVDPTNPKFYKWFPSSLDHLKNFSFEKRDFTFFNHALGCTAKGYPYFCIYAPPSTLESDLRKFRNMQEQHIAERLKNDPFDETLQSRLAEVKKRSLFFEEESNRTIFMFGEKWDFHHRAFVLSFDNSYHQMRNPDTHKPGFETDFISLAEITQRQAYKLCKMFSRICRYYIGLLPAKDCKTQNVPSAPNWRALPECDEIWQDNFEAFQKKHIGSAYDEALQRNVNRAIQVLSEEMLGLSPSDIVTGTPMIFAKHSETLRLEMSHKYAEPIFQDAQNWQHTPISILWLYGPSGCGKSTIFPRVVSKFKDIDYKLSIPGGVIDGGGDSSSISHVSRDLQMYLVLMIQLLTQAKDASFEEKSSFLNFMVYGNDDHILFECPDSKRVHSILMKTSQAQNWKLEAFCRALKLVCRNRNGDKGHRLLLAADNPFPFCLINFMEECIPQIAHLSIVLVATGIDPPKLSQEHLSVARFYNLTQLLTAQQDVDNGHFSRAYDAIESKLFGPFGCRPGFPQRFPMVFKNICFDHFNTDLNFRLLYSCLTGSFRRFKALKESGRTPASQNDWVIIAKESRQDDEIQSVFEMVWHRIAQRNSSTSDVIEMLNIGAEVLCFVSFSGLEFIDLYLLERLFGWKEDSRSLSLFRFVFDAKIQETSLESSFLQTSISIDHRRLISSASKILILPNVLLDAIRNQHQQQATRKQRKPVLSKHKTQTEHHMSVFLNIDNMSAIQYIGLKKLYDLMYKYKRCIKMIRAIFRDRVNVQNVDVKIRSTLFQYARCGQQLLFLHSFLDSFLDADLRHDFQIFSECEMPSLAKELLEYLPEDKDAHSKFLSILQAFISNLAPVLRVNVHENTHNDPSFWKALLDRSIICDYRDKRETLYNKGSSIIEVLRSMEEGNVANFDFWKTVLSIQQIMTPFQKIRVFDEFFETREKQFEPNTTKKDSRPSYSPLPKIAAEYFARKSLRSYSDTVLAFLKAHCFQPANISTWLGSNCLYLVKILLMLKQSSIAGAIVVTDKRKYCLRDFAIWNEMFNSFNSSFEPSTNVRARLEFHSLVLKKNAILQAEAEAKVASAAPAASAGGGGGGDGASDAKLESNFRSIAPSNFDEYFKTQYELFASKIPHTVMKRVSELWLKTMNHPDLINCVNDVEFARFFYGENLAHLRQGLHEGSASYEHWFFNFLDDERKPVHISQVLFVLAFGLGVLRVKNISNAFERDSDVNEKKLIIWGNISGRQDNAFYDPDYFVPLAWRLYNQYKDDFLVFHERTVVDFHSYLRKGIGVRHAKCVITALQFLNFCIVKQNPKGSDYDEIIEWINNDPSPIHNAGEEVTTFVSLHLPEMKNCGYLKELKECIGRNISKDSTDIPSFEQDMLNYLCQKQMVRVVDVNDRLVWNETTLDSNARKLAIHLLFTNRKMLNSVRNRPELVELILSESIIGESCNHMDWTPEGQLFLNSVLKALERDLGALALKNEGDEFTWLLDHITAPQVTMFSDTFSPRISSGSRISKVYIGLFLQDFRTNKSIHSSDKLEEWFLSVDTTMVWSTVSESPLDFASFFCFLNRKKYIEFSDIVEFRWNLHTLLEKFFCLNFYKRHVVNINDKVTEKSELLKLISEHIKFEQEAHPNGFAHDPFVTKEQVFNKMVSGLKVLNIVATSADPTATLKWQNPKYFQLQTAAFVAHNLPDLIACKTFRDLVQFARTKENDEVKCEFLARNVSKFLTERKFFDRQLFHWNTTGNSSSYMDHSLYEIVRPIFVEMIWKKFHNWFDIKDFVTSSAFLNAVEPPLDIGQAKKFLDCLLVFKGTSRQLLRSEYFGGLMVMHHDDFGVNWDESLLSIEQSAKSLFEQNKKELISCITRAQLNQVLKCHNLSADVSQYLNVWTLTNAPKKLWSEFSIIEKNCGEERFKILRYVDSKFLMWFEPDEVHLQIAEDLYLHKKSRVAGMQKRNVPT